MRRIWVLITLAGAAMACGSQHPAFRSIAVPDFLNNAPRTPELLILGVFHFHDPGLDL
jgi:hypothetical protein